MQIVHPSNIDPVTLSQTRRAVVVDIRSFEERHGPLGYIPGSIWVPEDELRIDPVASLCAHRTEMYALACQSGRRSGSLVRELHARIERPVLNLDGGLLGWHSAGLPVCGTDDVPASEVPVAESFEDLVRVVRSCFVAESIETSLNAEVDDDFDPVQMVQALFSPRLGVESPDMLQGALDRLARVAWYRGHALDKIASNVDRMRVVIERLTEGHHG